MVRAKNYLADQELRQLARIVSAYLDMAEAQAERRIPMIMADCETRLNGVLTLWDREVLQDAGKISAELAKLHAETDFEKYRIIQDRLYDYIRVILISLSRNILNPKAAMRMNRLTELIAELCLLPPVSRFYSGGRAVKKQGVIDKLLGFFEKYFGLG